MYATFCLLVILSPPIGSQQTDTCLQLDQARAVKNAHEFHSRIVSSASLPVSKYTATDVLNTPAIFWTYAIPLFLHDCELPPGSRLKLASRRCYPKDDEKKGQILRSAYATQRRTRLATAPLQSLPCVSPHKQQAKGSEVSFPQQ